MKYLQKKQNAETRGIDFTFTLLEWEYFQSLQYKVPCAYTGVKFQHKQPNSKHVPTIERIDNKGPYSYANCVWVTHEANQAKARYLEVDPQEVPTADKRLVNNILESISDLKSLRVAYELAPMHEDALHTREYSNLVNRCFSQGLGMSLSYAEYKKIVTRKTCSLTKRPVGEGEGVVFIVDRDKPICKANILFTSASLRSFLDRLREDSSTKNLSFKQLASCLSILDGIGAS